MTVRSVAVVGASLAGLRAVQTLRRDGFDGTITVVGADPRPPYDRPPLSKRVLTGSVAPDGTALAAADELAALDADWILGRRAVALDAARRELRLDDDRRLRPDGIVLATGAEPRHLPGTDGIAGVHVLRSADDAAALRADLERGPGRVVVVGAGFIGSEVTASCRTLGLDVTLVEAAPVPLERVLGLELGAWTAEVHRAHGVDVRLGVGVDGLDAGGDGRVARVRLADGSALAADVVVIGVGVRPATDWLVGSGLTLDDGIVCDATTLAAPGIVAAGDVARWASPRYGELLRIEHWNHAVEMGIHAARRLLADGAGEPFDPIPWFWSDQYDLKLQLAGRSGPDHDVRVVHGAPEEGRFVALFGRDGRLDGAFGVNRAAQLVQWRQRLAEGTSWADALAAAEG